MSLLEFHPAVARWFREQIGEPTPAQELGWESIRAGRHTLIAAPTGSGKTLAAFLNAIDELLREGLQSDLPEETRVIYVSPLKALSSDIHKNLAEPRREIRQLAEQMGLSPARITAAVRTGDTPASERAAMLKHPPHILVTTPESLYLLLTAEKSREMLKTVRTVIVDEIHSMIESRRGAHLSLSLQRLDHIAIGPIQRIGLSATQKPIETVGAWLVGNRAAKTDRADGADKVDRADKADKADKADQCMPLTAVTALTALTALSARSARSALTTIDYGHRRALDLGLELPGAPLEAVMSGEVWQEVYQRLTDLVSQHRTTLIFVNTRRLAERLARQLAERLGEDAVTAHHGSLAKEARLDAEERLKSGRLRALVATASLELGIDIGHVDLVCQIASPRRIATFLQRVGRSGHTISGTPVGRLFPLTLDDLVECSALLRSVRRGELDRLEVMEQPLDVLAQQIVAETAAEDWSGEALFQLYRGAYPYRDLTREQFDEVVQMVAEGFTTRRGRRGALVHHDAINDRLRGRRGARMTAITSGGAIPENADYRVILEPDGITVGTLNEDFAIESSAGDIFQLGNTSWRIRQVVSGTVRVEDAKGQPPTIPFWLGEAPARSAELSAAVAELRTEVEQRLDGGAVEWLEGELRSGKSDGQTGGRPESGKKAGETGSSSVSSACSTTAAQQIVAYFTETRRMLGALPTQQTIIAERFFDEAGGMQLVIHSPFGSRVNRAWGLALRKRFCRQFNFELQAAATDEALLLSLGPQHSFPLDEVFLFLHPSTVKSILVQALLDAPMFGTRWRWNANISLAVPRSRSGAKIPPPLQRMMADDLLAAVFPDAAACLENIAGDREVPEHPLARQTIADCLHLAMDIDRLLTLLTRIHDGDIRLIARDLPQPSPLSHEILNAKPYAFLDDAPLEERRTQAVYTRRALEPGSAGDLGALDASAIARVREEAWPDPRDADEMHDGLLLAGFFTREEADKAESWAEMLQQLANSGRARLVEAVAAEKAFWVATERLDLMATVHPSTIPSPPLSDRSDRATAIRELLRGRLEILGPTSAAALAGSLGIVESDVDVALAQLEGEGIVLRGSFTSGHEALEWCDRRLLARIHRYTLNRLRAEIAPVSAAEYMRFLLAWQRVQSEDRARGLEGLASVISLLDGYECAAAAWEHEVLGNRCEDYDPAALDSLCLTGRVAWGRVSGRTERRTDGREEEQRLQPPVGSGGSSARPIRSTPIALFLRTNSDHWFKLSESGQQRPLSTYAIEVLAVMERRGASFFLDLVQGSGLLASQVEQALAELAATGLVTSDSFAGLRVLLTPSNRRKPLGAWIRRYRAAAAGLDSAGRWSLLRSQRETSEPEAVEACAWSYLRRYGVVFKRVLDRETLTVPWRKLAMVYRRLEARGEIRGGRFVDGMSGEQFALPEAVSRLREVRREGPKGRLLSITAADPLNLIGIITPGARIAALRRNRILFEDGVPLAVLEGGTVRALVDYPSSRDYEIKRALIRRRLSVRSPGEAATG